MTITEARKQMWLLRAIGLMVIAVGGVVSVTSLVKFLYAFSLEQNALSLEQNPAMIIIGRLIKIIYLVVLYAYHYILWPFWNIAPDISLPPPLSMDHLFTSGNMGFAIAYGMIFVGHAFRHRASFIAKRIAEVRDDIKKEALRCSMGGAFAAPAGVDVFIKLSPDEGWFSKLHALWIAPLGVGILLYLFDMN